MTTGPIIDWEAVWRHENASLVRHVSDALEVVSTAENLRGVRTRAPLIAGTLLLCERALATGPEPELASIFASTQESYSLWERECLSLLCDGSASDPQRVTNDAAILLKDWPGSKAPATSTLTVPLSRMKLIVDLNAYRCSPPVSEYAFMPDDFVAESEEERHSTYGLFLLGSLINHSCVPNVSKVLLDDWVFLRAARDIPQGEEITQFYCDIRMPLDMRQAELNRDFGFTCSCERCLFETNLQGGVDDGKLKVWRSLYSCQVPVSQPSSRQLQVSHLEGFIAEAESSARAVLKSYRGRNEQGSSQSHAAKSQTTMDILEQWMMWPLVPAFWQLAGRLGLDGRLRESLAVWRKAAEACKAVLPCSNVHLKALSELLLSAADLGAGADVIEEAAKESLRITALAYGTGFCVWSELIGFRMPDDVVKAAARVHAEMPSPNAAVNGSPIDLSWSIQEVNGRDDPGILERIATLRATCSAFSRLADINLLCSESGLLLSAPGFSNLL